MPEHDLGRNPAEAFHLFVEAFAVMRIARVSGLMDQDGERLSPDGLLPEAVAFKREGQLIGAAPMREKAAKTPAKIGWIVAKCERAKRSRSSLSRSAASAK